MDKFNQQLTEPDEHWRVNTSERVRINQSEPFMKMETQGKNNADAETKRQSAATVKEYDLDDDKYDIVQIDGKGIIRQKKISMSDGVILILSATLGAQFQFTVGPMLQDPVSSIILILVLFATSTAGTYLLWRTVQMTRLCSFHEIAYFLGGGRASILCILTIFVTYYTTLPSQYLSNMACTLASFYSMDIIPNGEYTTYALQPAAYSISLLAVTLALVPMCLIQDLQKFKYLGWIVLTIDTCILFTSIALIFEPKEGIINIKEQNYGQFDLSVGLLYIGQFCSVLQTQVYFLQIMQYTNEKRINKEGSPFIKRTHFLLVAYILLFSILCSIAYISNPQGSNEYDPITFIEKVLMDNRVGRIFYFQNVLIVFLSFPFKFYIGKEFFFILVDELKNRSLSTKIDQLKSYTSTRGVYTQEMIKKVEKDIYQIVRQPYLNYSKKKQVILTLVVLLPNVLLSYYYFFSVQSHDFFVVVLRAELLKIYKLAIQPFIMFFLPGYLYYQACVYFQDDSKQKYWGALLAVYGGLMTALVLAISIYYTTYLSSLFPGLII